MKADDTAPESEVPESTFSASTFGTGIPVPSSRSMRWAVNLGAAVMVLIGIILLFLLTQATNNQQLYERNYGRLFIVNVVVAAFLILAIGWVGVRLLLRLRQGRFGSRLLVKLAAIFALVGFAPGLMIYVVSYQFVSRSIESWFDVKVEGALDAGLNLGRSALDALGSDLASKTRAAATQLANQPESTVGLGLERVREQLVVNDIVLWSASGQQLASAGDSRFALSPERPTAAQLRTLRSQRSLVQIDGLDDASSAPAADAPAARIRVLALVPAAGFGLNAEPRILQVSQALPATLVANAVAVQEANREYQERALSRNGLRKMYIGTLTLALFLAIFSAVLLAVVLGNQLARPLLVLADGVRQVAAGDLRPKAAMQTRDELGGLTRSFAEMTQQLADARSTVQRSMTQLDSARASLQTILDNLTAGVIVLDESGRILQSNPGATRVLRAPLEALQGQRLAQVPGLAEFGKGVQHQFDSFAEERGLHGLDHWQQAFDLHPGTAGLAPGSANDAVNLIARGAELPDATRLLVFDDISEVVSAQRAQAWGEVARRLAHEIKNPLTPIQLSAERLEMKLDGKLPDAEQAILTKSVKTIVDQVDAMKRLVNEFRDYARLPAAELKPLDLNQLVTELLALYSPENALVPVLSELDPNCPPILGDAQQIRQVIHNLLQNAQDAANAPETAKSGRSPLVRIRTQWVASSRRVRLVVTDTGPGFPENILKRAFEPYVTTKPKGTGLGLAVVKKIADEHAARVDISNRVLNDIVQGAQVSLSFATVVQTQQAS